MSGKSSNPAGWWSKLEPATAELFPSRGDPDDPRLAEVIERWPGGPVTLRPGQPALLGFPCDEGVRRNHGRVGAAQAPNRIRRQLYRLTPWDPQVGHGLTRLGTVDLGNLTLSGDLEADQFRLGEVVAEILRVGAVPVLLGGGHETAFGHYLGYVQAGLSCAILNIDAHLDVRPYPHGSHSGSPFRQAFEHAAKPLGVYVVLGARSQNVAQAHWEFVEQHQGRVHWLKAEWTPTDVADLFGQELDRLSGAEAVLLTVDADAFRQADVPGVSAPSPIGLGGAVWPALAFQAGQDRRVRSLDLVEINPVFDQDDQTVRWAAVGLRQFLLGLAQRKPVG
jgi:formiminoglutamase